MEEYYYQNRPNSQRQQPTWRPTREVRVPPNQIYENSVEFESGNSFPQVDVPLIHGVGKERRCSRGGYRFQNVARNAFDYVGPDISSYTPDSDDPNVHSDAPSHRMSDHSIHHHVKSEYSSGPAYPQADVPYMPEHGRVSQGGYRFTDVVRNVYDYDDPKEWMKIAHTLPEYQQRARSKHYNAPGVIKSKYDHDTHHEEPEPVHYDTYHEHPEFQHRTKSKDYAKPGTLRSSYDHAGETPKQFKPTNAYSMKVSERASPRMPPLKPCKDYTPVTPKWPARNEYERSNRISEGKSTNDRKPLREVYERQNRYNEERQRQGQKITPKWPIRNEYERENRYNETKSRQDQITPKWPTRDQYNRQNRFNEEKSRQDRKSQNFDRQSFREGRVRENRYNAMKVLQEKKDYDMNTNRMKTEMERFREFEDENRIMQEMHPEDFPPNDYGTSHYSEERNVSHKNGQNVYESSQESFSHLHHY